MTVSDTTARVLLPAAPYSSTAGTPIRPLDGPALPGGAVEAGASAPGGAEKLREASQSFEALFIAQLLSEVREAGSSFDARRYVETHIDIFLRGLAMTPAAEG